MTIKGGCRCGAVRYQLAMEAVPPVYCCHCHDCQTWSGSAFTEQGTIRDVAIKLDGPITEYSYQTRSGARSHQRICSVCHTRILNISAQRPGLVLLRAGTLDASDTIVPRAHIWTKRKQSWITIPDDIPTFEENAPPAELAAILIRKEEG